MGRSTIRYILIGILSCACALSFATPAQGRWRSGSQVIIQEYVVCQNGMYFGYAYQSGLQEAVSVRLASVSPSGVSFSPPQLTLPYDPQTLLVERDGIPQPQEEQVDSYLDDIYLTWSPLLAVGSNLTIDFHEDSLNDTPLDFTVTACFVEPPGAGGGSGSGGSTPGVGAVVPDRTAPQLLLAGKRLQRVLRQRGVVVEVSCPAEACTATAAGSVSVPGAARSLALRGAKGQISRGGKTRLRLRLSKRNLSSVRRALRVRKRLRAVVRITVRDAAGNAVTKRRVIHLHR